MKKVRLINTVLKELFLVITKPYYYNKDKPLFFPDIAQFSITQKCNSKCSNCEFWKSTNFKDELSTEEIVNIVKELKGHGVSKISYTANGEIFTRKDIINIFSKTRECNVDFSFNTNGLKISREQMDKIIELNPYSIVIGLDGTTNEQYHITRGIERGFDIINKNIDTMIEKGITNLCIGTVITRQNVGFLNEIVNYAIEKKIKSVRFTALQFKGFGKKYKKEDIDSYKEENFLRTLREEVNLIKIRNRSKRIVRNFDSYLDSLEKYYNDIHYSPFDCVTAYNTIKILPNGDISLCPLCGDDALIGNARNNNIKDVWFSEKANSFRKQVRKKKCVKCYLSCYAETNMRYSYKYALSYNVYLLYRFLNY